MLKLRGITLNYDVTVNQGLRYEAFKERVMEFARTGNAEPMNIKYSSILRPSIKNASVISQPYEKQYRAYVGKGVTRSTDFKVLHFGYISPTNL